MSTTRLREYFEPQTLAKLKGLRLRAQRLVEGLLSGLHRSPRRGFSIEFAEHREYVPGDDLRYLDWKVFGRTDKLYLKQFEDETNLIAYLVLDTSAGMAYQGPAAPWSKWHYAQCLAAALAWLVLNHHDAVAVATFDERLRRFVPPAGGTGQLDNVLRVLDEVEPYGPTRVAQALQELATRLPHRGVVIVLSDLFDDAESVLHGLRALRFARHDVVVFQVLDPAEVEFDFQEPTRFLGLEVLRRLAVDPRALRRGYMAEFRAFCDRLLDGCRRVGIELWPAVTSRPLHELLVPFLERRAQRIV
ncbi:MAG: hypothetical protein KatS3mg110_2344 [Pirellulaceae bacterium]|nr:MAG: hypothetical protein KatS3mg110_2344 [Pirellulaceae bacterium]